jgi:radical SAM superfamily enzyme YgiQ (UPF0313 family)
MNVLLVRPVSFWMPIVIPPFGFGYIATSLRKYGYNVSILDCVKENYDYHSFERYIKKNSFDVIGFQLFTADFVSVKKSIEIIKNIDKNQVIVVGGAHPSCTPKTILNDLEDIDYAFWGEAERGFPELLDQISYNKGKENFSNISGLIYKDSEATHAEPCYKINRPYFEENLDKLGMPAWDLIPPDSYPPSPHGVIAKRLPTAPISITRGCPYPCTFCAAKTVTGRKLRCRSIDNVIDEIKLLHREYNVREIHIEDDNFTLKKDLVVDFCNSLVEEKLDISWACPNGVRLDTLDFNLLKIMKKSGCYSFAVGIESGSERVLKHMKKKLSLDLIKEKIELCSKVGIRTTGFFIVGYPVETKEDILKTIRFAKSAKLDRAEFANFMPLPGTAAYDYLIENSEPINTNWEEFLPNRYVVYSPKGISSKELRGLQQKAFFKFYFRLHIILGIIKEIKSWKHFWYILKRYLDTIF